MTSSRFIQLHTLTSYPSALLNRDDVGFAKRIPFGGATRTRISSQCLKRHWRTFAGDGALSEIQIDGAGAPMSVRSRASFERYVRAPLAESGVAGDLADAVTEALMVAVLGESAKAKKEKEKSADGKKASKKAKAEPAAEAAERAPIGTNQVTVLGRPELDFLLGEAKAIAASAGNVDGVEAAVKRHFTKERQANLGELRRGAGLDAALFGRMVTSDILARCDAAIHVAHAFTVHGEEAESDYFSAVDDLLSADDGLGSGHIGSAELTSGLYYEYVAVDVPLLVSNLEGGEQRNWTQQDRTLAAEVVRRLAKLVATVSPGAKKGSTAPYSYAHLVLAEVGSAQPRTLANAFVSPVRAGGNLVHQTYDALAAHVRDLDAMYGKSTDRRLAALGAAESLGSLGAERGTLDDLAAWLADRVRG